MEPKDRIIIALDVDSLDEAKSLVEDLAPYVGSFKIGLQLITAIGGPQAVRFIHSLGGEVFYDGKFNDIPNTVGQAARAVSKLDVKMFNVHASGGIEQMQTAVANKGKSLALAVTILTSLKAKDIYDIGYPSQWPGVETIEYYYPYNLDKHSYIWPLVRQMAHCAQLAGCDGIICSPEELEYLGQYEELNDLLKVTPGIRPEWAPANDQKRVMTPAQAINAGADYLVIGRPITDPPAKIGTPIDAAKKIVKEISLVL